MIKPQARHKDCFTKIVATLGPASSSKKVIASLVKAGVDVFRLNFSHGDIATHAANVKIIRDISKKTGRNIGILADMQGPKLRIGTFAAGAVMLKKGATFRLDMDDKPGDDRRVTLPHKEIFAVMHKGMDLLLNDGKVRLKVTAFGKNYAMTKVIVGGEISDHKGVNIPGVTLPISSLTPKDLTNLKAALKMGVDWIGLSFVQRPKDILDARKIIGDKAWIISKIEKPAAIDHLDEIIAISDAVMVARGDLGVEMPVEAVPVLQKKIVFACRRAGKPVVVATQMLESMITNPTPTRAETSDVATAVFDGADAVMLSGETAVGKYPVEAVHTMNQVIKNVEEIPQYSKLLDLYSKGEKCNLPIGAAITSSAKFAAEHMQDAAAIVTYTESGSTSLLAAKERPCLPILSITPNEAVAHRLALVWGIITRKADSPLRLFDDVRTTSQQAAKQMKLAKKGNKLIITAGVPFAHHGNTNTLHIISVE